MEIQWSLVLFTALTGTAGWMYACVAADEFLKKAPKSAFVASIVAFVVAVVGGLASVTHLSHPDRMLNALQHPTSGIFVEAALIGCFCVCVAIYAIMVKRGVSESARKVVVVIGAAFGIALSFMAGESYMMEARPNWNTPLLPLGYLGTAIPAGVAAYLTVVAARKEIDDAKPYAVTLLVGGVVAAVTALAYGLSAGALDATTGMLLALCVVGAGVVPAACGAVLRTKANSLLALAAASLVCALVGAVAYRCIMWLITVPVSDLLGIVL